jgi:hypothetical protein
MCFSLLLLLFKNKNLLEIVNKSEENIIIVHIHISYKV